jgi:predicted MFS family arabinose efflux permease
MGMVQAAFAGSQVLGIPLGLYLATHYGWHAPFLMIAGVSVVVGIVIFARLQPVVGHLTAAGSQRNPLHHLLATAARPRYQIGFAATMLLAVGGFMLMPFSSAFSVHNLGIPLEKLPMIYMITGISALISGPLMGRLSDRYGKYLMFCCASCASIVLVLYYTRLGITPISTVILLNVILFASISGRMVSAGALGSAIPELADRGAYMSISSSLQQFAGGAASFAAGMIVVQSPTGVMEHYPRLGTVVAIATALTIVLMYRVHRLVNATPSTSAAVADPAH